MITYKIQLRNAKIDVYYFIFFQISQLPHGKIESTEMIKNDLPYAIYQYIICINQKSCVQRKPVIQKYRVALCRI